MQIGVCPPIEKANRLVYDRNSFLLNVQKHSYCTQNFAEILLNRKRFMLLLPTEITYIIHLSVHNRNRNNCLFITETKSATVSMQKFMGLLTKPMKCVLLSNWNWTVPKVHAEDRIEAVGNCSKCLLLSLFLLQQKQKEEQEQKLNRKIDIPVAQQIHISVPVKTV